MSTSSKILLIEDQTPWAQAFSSLISELDKSIEVVRKDYDEFVKECCTTESFDDFDFCFVDLELGPASSSGMADELGMEEVLPAIRQKAPWVPVACISRFLEDNSEVVGVAGEAGFDAIYPKNVIYNDGRTSPHFNRARWRQMLQSLRLNRVSALTGRSLQDVSTSLMRVGGLNIELSDSVADELADANILKEGICLLGLEAEYISVNEILSGFSGINASHMKLYRKNAQEASEWFLKWGHPIRKLAREARGHREFFERGFDRSLMIPTLYNNPIPWKNLGILVYGFEAKATTAFELVEDQGAELLTHLVRSLCQDLYGERWKQPIKPRDVLQEWCPLTDRQQPSTRTTGGSAIEVSSTYLHGDLHLRNIFWNGEKVTLIDFARARHGPVAIDLAKLAVDIVTFSPGDILDGCGFKLADMRSSPMADVLAEMANVLDASDDEEFFEDAMKCFASKYLDYSDVSEETRIMIKEKLANGA